MQAWDRCPIVSSDVVSLGGGRHKGSCGGWWARGKRPSLRKGFDGCVLFLRRRAPRICTERGVVSSIFTMRSAQADPRARRARAEASRDSTRDGTRDGIDGWSRARAKSHGSYQRVVAG